MEDIQVGKYISRKEYLKKYDSNVGYALHIQNNIKKDDYVRLNTGEIVKVIGIKENNINKKAIYFGIYDTDWFDSSAVENFSANIIDLIEERDVVVCHINSLSELKVGLVKKHRDARSGEEYLGVEGFNITKIKIKKILPHEQFKSVGYDVEEE